ncbi:hypothetical protein PsAD26_01524 [Pseudovibrio sp. Ad26]|nr:hypothetical protein PsAD26_01524 [Pseudovibrio sp. Ad26]
MLLENCLEYVIARVIQRKLGGDRSIFLQHRCEGHMVTIFHCNHVAFLTYLLISALVVAALLGELLFEHAACFSSTHWLTEVETLHVFTAKLEQLQRI